MRMIILFVFGESMLLDKDCEDVRLEMTQSLNLRLLMRPHKHDGKVRSGLWEAKSFYAPVPRPRSPHPLLTQGPWLTLVATMPRIRVSARRIPFLIAILYVPAGMPHALFKM